METGERRQTLRHSFSKKDNDLIKSKITIDDEKYKLKISDLSLAGMNCLLEKKAAEKISKQNTYNIELELKNNKNVFIKGQLMWRNSVENNGKELSVGFYNFIPEPQHHINMLEFLQSFL